MLIFFVILSIVLAAAFIVGAYKLSSKLSLVCKIIASLAFIALSIYVASELNFVALAVLLIVRMCFSLIGDIMIATHEFFPPADKLNKDDYKWSDRMVTIAMLFFSVGHLLFLYSMNTYFLDWVITLGGSFVITVGSIFLMKKMKYDFRDIRRESILYMFVICTIMFASMAQLIRYGFNTATALSMGASLLFVISDLVLSTMYFKATKVSLTMDNYPGHTNELCKFGKCLKAINLATYYLAQILYCLAIYFLLI